MLVEEARGTLLDVFEGHNCLAKSYGSYARNLSQSLRGISKESSLRHYLLTSSSFFFAADIEDCA
jgi:hypothetical protein